MPFMHLCCTRPCTGQKYFHQISAWSLGVSFFFKIFNVSQKVQKFRKQYFRLFNCIWFCILRIFICWYSFIGIPCYFTSLVPSPLLSLIESYSLQQPSAHYLSLQSKIGKFSQIWCDIYSPKVFKCWKCVGNW